MRYHNASTVTSVLLLLLHSHLWKFSVWAQVDHNKEDHSVGNDSESPASAIPIIDLDPWTNHGNMTTDARKNVVRQIQDACSQVGFFLITNHGLDPTIFDKAWQVTEQFFDMPIEEKRRYETSNVTEYPYGFEQSEILTKGKALDYKVDARTAEQDGNEQATADLKETFSVGPSNPASGMPPRRWNGKDNTEFRTIIENYYEQMDRLSMLLLKLFALALDQPEAFFEDKMDHHMAALRLVNYYPITSPKMKYDVIRAGAHTDYGALTILNARDTGLQVYLLDTNDSDVHSEKPEMSWQDVPLVSGALIINLGDLMQRWTNGMLKLLLAGFVATAHFAAISTHFANIDVSILCQNFVFYL